MSDLLNALVMMEDIGPARLPATPARSDRPINAWAFRMMGLSSIGDEFHREPTENAYLQGRHTPTPSAAASRA